MKTLKHNASFFSLLTLITALLFLSSCEQENIIEQTQTPESKDSESAMAIRFPADTGHDMKNSVDGINGYQWWDITLGNVYNLDSRIRPTVMGNNTYFASGGWFNNGQGWYMGLQQKGDGTRTLHAAIWDSNAAEAGMSSTCSNFSGEGVGKKCWRNYNWSTLSSGLYRLRIWRLNEDAQGRWWGFWVIAPDGTELHIGNIRAAIDADFIKNNTTQDHYNFIENWSHGSYPTCQDVPAASHYAYWPRFNNNLTGSVRMGISETNCVDVTKEETATLLKIGGCGNNIVQGMVSPEIAQRISIFNATKMKKTGKTLLHLYITHQSELTKIFTSKEIKYQSVQAALDELTEIGKPLIENSFGVENNAIVTKQHTDLMIQVLSELEAVAESKSLIDLTSALKNSMPLLAGKDLKVGLEAIDRMDTKLVRKY